MSSEADWKLQRLGDVLERVVRPVEVDLTEQYRQIGVRSHAKGVFHKAPVTGKELGNKRVFWVEPNCLVLNIVFAWEQAVSETSDREEGMIASHRFPMYRPRDGRSNVTYLRYYFSSPRGKYDLELASPGGAGRNKTLGQAEFNNLKVRLPPQAEQLRIAQVLSTWDRAITVVERLIENAESRKRSLMQKLLTGKERLPGYDDAWNRASVEQVAEVIVSPVDKQVQPSETTIRLCNYTDVYHNDQISSDMDFSLGSAKKSEIKRFSLKQGDVVITKDSENPDDIAVPAYVEDELDGVVCGYHLAILRPNARIIDGQFLAYLLRLPRIRYYFSTLANGVTRFGLTVDGIRRASLAMPQLYEQKAISKILRVADAEMANLRKQLDSLRTAKKGLMQQLLSGKRRVKLAGLGSRAADEVVS